MQWSMVISSKRLAGRRRTIEWIERDLVHGGVHRYASDTYYGGGEWLLLTAWLGWCYLEAGEPGRARELLAWIESRAGQDGSMPEQVPEALIDPPSYDAWLQRWGPVADPLLWSHAMYLILHHNLAIAGGIQARKRTGLEK
jgi:GH15 family glucan-1,4-alpha-glucosidase